MSDMWLEYMVARNMNSSLCWSVLPHLPLPLESGRQEEPKYVLLKNIGPQLMLKSINLKTSRQHFPYFRDLGCSVPGISLTARHADQPCGY